MLMLKTDMSWDCLNPWKAVVFAYAVDAQVCEGGSERAQAVESPVASPAKCHGIAVLADAADAAADATISVK